MNNNKIQAIITSIYDWLDCNAAFKVVNRGALFCKSERFHSNRNALRYLITDARELLAEFTGRVEKINACLIRMHKEIDDNVDKQLVTKKQLNLLLKDNDVQVKSKDLLIAAKCLKRVVNSQNYDEKINNDPLLQEADNLSNLILTKYEDLDTDSNQLKTVQTRSYDS